MTSTVYSCLLKMNLVERSLFDCTETRESSAPRDDVSMSNVQCTLWKYSYVSVRVLVYFIL